LFNGFHFDSPQAVIEQVVDATVELEQVVCQPVFAVGERDLRQFLSIHAVKLTIFVSVHGQKLATDGFCQANLVEMPFACR
jgi:hypothetical protein